MSRSLHLDEFKPDLPQWVTVLISLPSHRMILLILHKYYKYNKAGPQSILNVYCEIIQR